MKPQVSAWGLFVAVTGVGRFGARLVLRLRGDPTWINVSDVGRCR